ncbi:LA2681 family HEPN domain-containing protein [Pseudomonas sp.]|uniref:LA2681 family HEPN domain-containing protein n=1 Tax=Pseudomonas sp. TaxID=306 RepID=UPI003267A50D
MLNQKALDDVCGKIDELIDSNNHIELEKLLEEIEEHKFCDSKDQAHFYYSLGTGHLSFKSDFKSSWVNDTAGKAVKFFRKAMYEDGFKDLHPEIRSRIITNFGGALLRQGRKFEALAEFNKAIAIDKNPVALLKKGITLLHLSGEVFDVGHQIFYQYEAYKILKNVYEKKDQLLDVELITAMERDIETTNFLKWYDENIEHLQKSPYPNKKIKNNITKKEKAYRDWCIKNSLYINDLNEILSEHWAEEDILTLPSLVHLVNPLLTTSETLALNAAFSEIKHQYAFARFNYFDAITSLSHKKEIEHFSDNQLHLTNSLDYCLYRRDIEMIKVSFRLLYSCFDKASMLMKKYLTLDIKDNNVTFSRIWFTDTERKKTREYFTKSNNIYLLALYWLSRDINDNEDINHNYWMDSNALKLADIRNKMEHQGFRVTIDYLHKINKAHTIDTSAEKQAILRKVEELRANLANSTSDKHTAEKIETLNHLQDILKEEENLKGYPLIITDIELREQTFRLMRSARYAIIYLALGIHHAEKQKPRDENLISMAVPKF